MYDFILSRSIFEQNILHTMGSNAVGQERKSKVVGYVIQKGDNADNTPNLPQRVVLVGEANNANQSTLNTDPKQISSAQQAGQLYGYGSPIHMAARILFPKQGSGIGGIPVIVHPQAEAGGSAYKVIEVEPTGIAEGNGTHYLRIAGRDGLDGDSYAINILEGDTQADITAKIEDAVNAILGCPMTSTSDDYVATCTSKWKGKTANLLTIEVDTGDDDLGITYSVTSIQSGSGTPSIAQALTDIGQDWVTIVLNSYGTESTIMDALEAFNGIPATDTPTGRYTGIIMKPLIGITGSVDDDPSAITDARADEVTIAIAPAPNSKGLPLEAAANMTILFARIAQDKPHLDVSGRAYPDMPTPTSIGSMSEYNNRDIFVKKGCSTVELKSKKYYVCDFVTTYHPIGENPPQFAYCRNLNIDWNIFFRYYILQQTNVIDKAIADDNDVVTVDDVIKPRQWKQILSDAFEDWAKLALIVKPGFSLDSLVVNLSNSNPDRFETNFAYKRTGYVRIASTTAEANFNFGELE